MNKRKKTQQMSKTETAKKKRQDAFLKEYKLCATITHAAEIALISRRTHYVWIEKDPTYAERFEEAKVEATDALVSEARRRAIQGVEEPILYKGEVVKIIKKYSDTLLIFLLKGALPEVYRERHELTGGGGAPLIPDPGRKILTDEKLRTLIAFAEQLTNPESA